MNKMYVHKTYATTMLNVELLHLLHGVDTMWLVVIVTNRQ